MTLSELAQVWSAYLETKDRALRDHLIMHYIPYVERVIKRLRERLGVGLPPGVEYEDLLSYGIIGLMGALDRFDPGRGAKFESYARRRIWGEAVDGLRSMGPISRRVWERATEIEQWRGRMVAELGREPSDSEIAERMGLSLAEVHERLVHGRPVTVSLEDVMSGDDGKEPLSLSDLVGDDSMVEPWVSVEEEEFARVLAEALGGLPERERLIVQLYYQEELTMREIGALVGVSESRVSQLHAAAISSLRVRLAEHWTPSRVA
jgi:RNA polymerase sigma factor for flagellar operon FliA